MRSCSDTDIDPCLLGEIDLFQLHSASVFHFFLVSTSFDSSLLLLVLIQRICLGNIGDE